MPSFVRKNLLTISGKFFTAPTGPCGNPNPQNWGDSNDWSGQQGCTGPGQAPAFMGTAAVNGSTATVTNIGFGVLAPGNLFTMPGIPLGTTIVAQLNGAAGGLGQYQLSNSGLSIPSGQVVGYFVPAPAPEPSTVFCKLAYYAPVTPPPACPPNDWPFGAPGYCPPAPPQLTQTISLTLQSDGVTWQGTWDSSVAEGRVDWVVYSAGSVQAAAQGTFYVQANSANVQVA
jgi:hypothetical protein